MMRVTALLLTLCLAIGVSGCSGSGGEPQPPSDEGIQLTLLDQGELYAGQSVALMADREVDWQQLQGPAAVELLAAGRLIGFDLPAAGTYQFSATDGEQNSSIAFTVLPATDGLQVNARRDRTLNAGSAFSLRASYQLPDGAALESIQWQQLSGPIATLTQTDEAVLFVATSFSDAAQTLRFEVAVSDSFGSRATDQITVLLSPNRASSSALFRDAVVEVQPYRTDSPYATALQRCIYSNQLTSPCTLDTLPLLGQYSEDPSLDQILDRLLVSHPWMGDNFAAFLRQHDPYGDFRRLLRAVPAIVIASDIRPSFYWAATGAIYLDADYLWLTPAQRDLINEQPDYRSDYGSSLQFDALWRYVDGNQYAFSRPAYSSRETRSVDQLAPALSYLLYHELAHANDYFPPAEQLSLDGSKAPYSATFDYETLAMQLQQVAPLQSAELIELAQVSFRGELPSELQQRYLASDVASWFDTDLANDYYGYSSIREDIAMLFEELMMASRLGLQRDIAFTPQPESANPGADDYIVSWGVRGRIAEPQLRQRVIWAAQRLLPELDAESMLDALNAPAAMQPDLSWRANLSLGEPLAGLRQRTLNYVDSDAASWRPEPHYCTLKPLP